MGGTHWKMVCAALKTPFSCPPDRTQDPHYSIFQFSWPYDKFLEILSSKAPEIAKSLVPELQIRLKFSWHGYILSRNSVHNGSKFGSGLYQNESWVPFPFGNAGRAVEKYLSIYKGSLYLSLKLCCKLKANHYPIGTNSLKQCQFSGLTLASSYLCYIMT